MTTIPANRGTLSANDEFKQKYPKYLRWSAVAAVLLTLLMFLFSPKYVPNPYKLVRTEIEVFDLPDAEDIVLPPPPQDIPPPPKVVEAAPDEEVTEDVEIAETLLDFDDAIATPMTDIGGLGDEVFVASQTKPELIFYAPPDYPEVARMSQLEGTVIVKVLVGPDGSVMAADIVQSVHPILNKAALAAARKCRFNPGKQRNIPVKAWMAIPYRFRLN